MSRLDIFDSTSPASRSRIGWIVPRYGHPAVERNRLKRRLREVSRAEVLPRLDAAGLRLDVLVRARRDAYDAGFTELRDLLAKWTERRCSARSSSE